ncbi:MAG: CotH kinase family protein [Prevotella sp.]|nr:CotH kinase family protein [Prevotella sp.]
MRKFALLTVVAMAMPFALKAQLVINELMQSNIDCIMDDRNEFPDSWVELYNQGEGAANLQDYSIGLTDNANKAWKLPTRQLVKGSYLVIFCDKEADKLHTDFKLESGEGGAVYLFKNGIVVDKVTAMAKQPAPNIAYGRRVDASEQWGYMEKPTPGAANNGKVCNQVLGEPVFSEKGRVVEGKKTIFLRLSVPEGSPEGTVIRFTFNGSEPTESSPVYQGQLSITKTEVIRAKLFCEGWLSPRATTHSYIFHNRQVTIPVVSLVTDNSYFFDNKLGIYVDGTYKSGKKNYEYDWRRPVNFEYFEGANVESGVNQLCETRVQGGASRGAQLKSLIVYANKRFGKKRLKYEFFPDQRPGQDNFKSIILRNAGNDFDYLYMRDAIIQRTMAANTDLDWQAWRPVAFYVNGIYKGMLNIRERSTGDNIFTNYDGLEDIDILENWWEVKEGDDVKWKEFQQFYGEKGHTLEEYAKWIDWKEFINLMVMNLFYNNQDFPGNNIVMWRPRTDDGVWRFVAKDTDFGLGLYGTNASYNSIEWIYNPNYDSSRSWANQYEHTRLFRRMMDDKDFKREFIDRAAIYMGDFMNLSGTRVYWDPMYEAIKTEYPHHRKLINQWWPNYDNELTTARNWLAARPDNFYNHLSKYYQLGNPVPIQVNVEAADEDLEAVVTTINGIPLSKGMFDGKFFAGRPMSIQTTPIGDRQVTGWTMVTVSSSGTSIVERSGPSLSFNVPNCQKVIIRADFDDYDGLDDLREQFCQWRRDGNRLTLSGVPSGQKVFVYDLRGILVAQGQGSGGDMLFTLPASSIYVIRMGNQAFKVR